MTELKEACEIAKQTIFVLDGDVSKLEAEVKCLKETIQNSKRNATVYVGYLENDIAELLRICKLALEKCSFPVGAAFLKQDMQKVIRRVG